MSKNKGKYHGGEDAAAAAAQPMDQFVGFWDRVGRQLTPHKNKLIAGAVAVGALIGAFAIYGWWDSRREKGATRAFYDAMALADAPVVGEGEPPPPTMPGAKPEVTYKTAKDRSEATLAALAKLESSFGGADVARHTRLAKAAVLYDLGRYDEAQAEYKKFLGAKPASDVLVLVAREGLGYAIEAKALAQKDAAARAAGLDAALAEYKQLQPDEKGFYHDRAVYHQARVLQLKGDKAGAIALYKQIVDGMPGSQVASDARARLAVLE